MEYLFASGEGRGRKGSEGRGKGKISKGTKRWREIGGEEREGGKGNHLVCPPQGNAKRSTLF